MPKPILKLPWTSSKQIGKPGHCILAQVFDKDGIALAYMDATVDPKVATARAKFIVKASTFFVTTETLKDILTQIRRKNK